MIRLRISIVGELKAICDDEAMVFRYAAALLASVCWLCAQYPATPVLSADRQLSMLLTEADHAKVLGDHAAAVKGYEDALNRVHADATLKNREQEVLQHLAAGYIAAQRPKDAVRVSAIVLGLHKDDCKPGAPGLESCADAQYGLGLAMMHAGDFEGAVAQLNASVANFGRVPLEGDEMYRMTKLKQRGDAEALAAAALFRAGQKPQAIAAFRKAIATLSTVANNQKIDPGTRGSAQTSLKDAQSSLAMLEKK
jgi:tetratricopeptide (TPR) repeat protein